MQKASSVICWNTSIILLFSKASKIYSDLCALLEAKKIFIERGREPGSVSESSLLTCSEWLFGKERFKSVLQPERPVSTGCRGIRL